jgi:AIR synthase-related protein
MSLQDLAQRLNTHPAIRSKTGIAEATLALGLNAQSAGRPGDDAAPLPRAGGYDLLAGEGFIPAFVKDDPWFAGWCAMMVNLSDIAAMGGRSVAMVDHIWAPNADAAAPLLKGLRDASAAYGVPLVGGHTNLNAAELGLSASVFGRANALITSFDAAPDDILIAAIDHRGAYRNFDNFCAALEAPPERLRGDLEILPTLAENGLTKAGKDISQGGIVGTALMLAECSGVGIDIDLAAITPPVGIPKERWLHSFPSFGYLLCVRPDDVAKVCAHFTDRDIHAAPIGRITNGSALALIQGSEAALFWDHAVTPYLNLGGQNA